MRGDDVIAIQKAINILSTIYNNINTVDVGGIYGNKTDIQKKCSEYFK
jgi:hypothetical protein